MYSGLYSRWRVGPTFLKDARTSAVGFVVADKCGVFGVTRDEVDVYLGLVHIVASFGIRTDVNFVACEHEEVVVGQVIVSKGSFVVCDGKDAVAVGLI